MDREQQQPKDEVTTFALRNDAPKTKKPRFDGSDRSRQQNLFIGLHDLPGQKYLIPETNT
jgi:hypothetical protein